MEIATFVRRDRACRPVLVVSGELDLSVAQEFGVQLGRLTRDGHSPAYLDLTRVTFFDSTGINTLIDAVFIAESHGVDLVIDPSQRVLKTLELVGLADRFHLGPPPTLPELRPSRSAASDHDTIATCRSCGEPLERQTRYTWHLGHPEPTDTDVWSCTNVACPELGITA